MGNNALLVAAVALCLLGTALGQAGKDAPGPTTAPSGSGSGSGTKMQEDQADAQRRDECLKELQLNDDDLKKEENAMKVLSCIFKKEGLITADGKFSREGAVEVAKQFFKEDDEMRKEAIATAEECDKKFGGEVKSPEDTALMILECYSDFHKKSASKAAMKSPPKMKH